MQLILGRCLPLGIMGFPVPLNTKGKKILMSMKKTYGSAEKGKRVFYASRNAGRIRGVDPESTRKMK